MQTNLNTSNSVVLECNVTPLWNTVQSKICLRLGNLSHVKSFPFGSTFHNNIPKITLCNLFFPPHGATVPNGPGLYVYTQDTPHWA